MEETWTIRPPKEDFLRRSSSSRVSRKWPRTSIRSVRSRISAAAFRTEASEERSSRTKIRLSRLQPSSREISSIAWAVVSSFRQAKMTRAPFRAATRAVSLPRPPLAPVMTTVRPERLSGSDAHRWWLKRRQVKKLSMLPIESRTNRQQRRPNANLVSFES
ncbi:hypothetical protein TYRP_019473 [Tyrophagus putrescentiae]|nr:hypothetical protein TYRP_019473 [Tyrophagus putrescentiae]